MDNLELAKKLLEDGDCTLAIVSEDMPQGRKYYRRGVADLLQLLDAESLQGASVADKIIGKAAAALLILGKAHQAYGRRMTADAFNLLTANGIQASCSEEIPLVQNRDHTGRCPLDTLCAPLSEPAEMADAIRLKLEQLQHR